MQSSRFTRTGFHQNRCAKADIEALIVQCRGRYCSAHELIKPHANLPEGLFDRFIIDPAAFHLPWSKLCSAYRKHHFDPQICFFEDQRRRELRRWQDFVQRECFARFDRRPEWICAVLETAELIPQRGPTRTIPVADLFGDIIQNIEERSEHDQEDED